MPCNLRPHVQVRVVQPAGAGEFATDMKITAIEPIVVDGGLNEEAAKKHAWNG